MISGAIFEVALFTQPESLRACALAEVAAVIGGVLRGFRWLQVTGSLKNRRSRSFDFAETAGQTHFCRLTAQSCVLSGAPPELSARFNCAQQTKTVDFHGVCRPAAAKTRF